MIQFEYSSIDLFKKKEEYILSSVIGEDNIFYGIYQKDSGKLMASSFLTDLDNHFFLQKEVLFSLFSERDLFNESITEIRIAFATEHFSLLPYEVEMKEEKEFAENFSYLVHDDDYLLCKDDLSNLEIFNYFMLPRKIKEFTEEHFGISKIVHFNSALISRMSIEEESFILFNFLDKRLQTVVVKKGEFLQSNDYGLEGKDDALYYALMNCKRFDFDPSIHQFYFTGTLNKNSTQFEIFNSHFRFLDLLGNKDRLKYANVFLGKEKHLFFDLDCVFKCES